MAVVTIIILQIRGLSSILKDAKKYKCKFKGNQWKNQNNKDVEGLV